MSSKLRGILLDSQNPAKPPAGARAACLVSQAGAEIASISGIPAYMKGGKMRVDSSWLGEFSQANPQWRGHEVAISTDSCGEGECEH